MVTQNTYDVFLILSPQLLVFKDKYITCCFGEKNIYLNKQQNDCSILFTHRRSNCVYRKQGFIMNQKTARSSLLNT